MFYRLNWYGIFVLSLLSAQAVAVVSESPFAHFIADNNNQVSPVLRQLAAITGIDPVPQDLATFVQVTQKEWLRGPIERWEILDTKYGKLRNQIMPLLESLELLKIQSITERKNPDYLLILGATVATMSVRLLFAQQLIEKELLSPKKVVVLVGQRPLTQEERNYAKQLNITQELTTETDAARALLELALHGIYKKFEVDIVDTPGTYNEKGAFVRPTTDTTIAKWLHDFKPAHHSSVVAISTMPFVQYQDAVLRLLLPSTFKIITLGGLDDPDEAILLYLDSLARWIYQEHKRRQALS